MHRIHTKAFGPCCWLVPGLTLRGLDLRSRTGGFFLFFFCFFNLGASKQFLDHLHRDVVHRRAAERLRWWLWLTATLHRSRQAMNVYGLVSSLSWALSLLSLTLTLWLSPHTHTPGKHYGGERRADWMQVWASRGSSGDWNLNDARK